MKWCENLVSCWKQSGTMYRWQFFSIFCHTHKNRKWVHPIGADSKLELAPMRVLLVLVLAPAPIRHFISVACQVPDFPTDSNDALWGSVSTKTFPLIYIFQKHP